MTGIAPFDKRTKDSPKIKVVMVCSDLVTTNEGYYNAYSRTNGTKWNQLLYDNVGYGSARVINYIELEDAYREYLGNLHPPFVYDMAKNVNDPKYLQQVIVNLVNEVKKHNGWKTKRIAEMLGLRKSELKQILNSANTPRTNKPTRNFVMY